MKFEKHFGNNSFYLKELFYFFVNSLHFNSTALVKDPACVTFHCSVKRNYHGLHSFQLTLTSLQIFVNLFPRVYLCMTVEDSGL